MTVKIAISCGGSSIQVSAPDEGTARSLVNDLFPRLMGLRADGTMHMLTVDDLLPLLGPFCEARGISESRVSKLLFNDGKRIKSIRERNSDVSSRGLREAFQWFSDNWPVGAEWPSHIPRPERGDAADSSSEAA